VATWLPASIVSATPSADADPDAVWQVAPTATVGATPVAAAVPTVGNA